MTVRSADGTSIAVWSAGSGPPLLLVHGAMSDHRRWRITPLLEPHRTVHAMDRRGRGGSGDAPEWSLEREVEDVVAVVETLADGSGSSVDLLGHSLGGLLALRAAGATGRVRRLVVYEPSVDEAALPPDLVDRMRGLLAANRRDEVVLMTMREVVLMPEEEIAAMVRLPSWPTRVAAAHTLPRELSVPLHWDPAEAARVTAPTLVLVGGDSPEFIQAEVRLVADALPDCRIAVIHGQQHVADQFVPDLFARLVLDFLLGPAGR
jgi:pimeloyl-ACP methyl ester carboxylesterase